MVRRVKGVVFYDEPSVPEIDLDGLAKFAESIGLEVEMRGPITQYGGQETFAALDAARIWNPRVPLGRQSIHDFDESGILRYDGIEMHRIFGAMIRDEIRYDTLHVVFTNMLGCTYDQEDLRYHGRAVICANPAIISTTGMVEAPAKSREYHLDVIASYRIGDGIDGPAGRHAGEFLEYHDSRLPAIAQGYFLQAFLYHVSGEPFCSDRGCRLYNAHWQRDLLHAQIESGRLCERHQIMLKSIGGRCS